MTDTNKNNLAKWERLRMLVKHHQNANDSLTLGFTELLKINLELHDRVTRLEVNNTSEEM